jgi:uncharacterized protein (UPF0212 family)
MTRACAKCGASDLKFVAPSIYNYKISGLDNVYLKCGVTEYICPKCGTKNSGVFSQKNPDLVLLSHGKHVAVM